MASSLAEDLVCPICLALFQEPHMLGCGHNFCLACLQSAVPGGQEAAGTCPECRSPFRLAELKRNRALGNVAGKVRRWGGDGGAPVARWHFCEEHDEPLKLFCAQDQGPLCVICRDTPRHRGHDFMPTSDAARVAQGKLKEYLKQLEKQQVERAEDKTDQMKEIEELKKCTEDLLAHVSQEFEVLHQILRQKEQDIKLTIETMKKENMDEMEESLIFLEEEVSLNTKTVANVNAALDTTDHVAFLKDFKELMEKVKQHHWIEIEDLEKAEEKPEDDNRCEEQCEDGDSEDGDDEDYEPEETEDELEETGLDDDDRVVPVELALGNFGESLDFKAWKEMLEGIKPGTLADWGERAGPESEVL